ncbi:kinesin-like protein KIF6 isoform X1 [Anarrhichthys ocellatus]|uniref:kinesin-like protein KIF6 isoform X1 n=1 Tax=Anarrhichthys ocellatus TaxID=433405 RepID=UPI0012ECE9E9|nr:kinesin-like protein KIF6 isoform X1 [Anarrhichthys ocellatus]
MKTGEQRDEQLTVEEIQRVEELVKAFLEEPDPDVTLSLGPDMRKLQHCFSLLKIMIMDKQSGGHRHGDGQASPAAKVIQESPHSAAEVTKLKEMMTQRDDEISILVKMLKKEKKKALDAAAQLANIPNGESLASQSSSRLTAAPLSREGSTVTISADYGGRAIQYMRRGPQLSMGKQEAFETFIRDHEDHLTIEDNKELLKQRSAEARRFGEKLNEARNRINELKKQLALQRGQRAALGVTENRPKVEEEVDPVEENLCKHIEQEKKAYKSTIDHLKALRTEIEHLQLLLERAKVKLQRDFHKWWSQEASSMQESEATARCHTGSPHGTLQLPSPSTPGFRALSTTKLSSSSIPLTGDQQTDADILAFVKARQNLLNRTGNTHAHAHTQIQDVIYSQSFQTICILHSTLPSGGVIPHNTFELLKVVFLLIHITFYMFHTALDCREFLFW